MAPSLSDELALLLAAAKAAGEAALPYFNPGKETSAEISYKEGNSPVSEADLAANTALEQHLRAARPDYHLVSEETIDGLDRLAATHLFVVDPIDGTRAFIAGRLQWSVSVGLVIEREPVAGVIHAPSLGITYMAAKGLGATCNGQKIGSSGRSKLDGSVAAGPKPSLEALEQAASIKLEHGPRIPSLALRLALAAEGKIDLALASTGPHDWDVAAADIILQEAGAVLLDLQGKRLIYNRPSLRRGILCAGPPGLAEAAANLLGLR
jgi:myo-inositol-1(or 4)-monophosphatase